MTLDRGKVWDTMGAGACGALGAGASNAVNGQFHEFLGLPALQGSTPAAAAEGGNGEVSAG